MVTRKARIKYRGSEMKRLALVLTVLLVVLLSLPVLETEYDFNGRTIKIAGHVGDGMRSILQTVKGGAVGKSGGSL